MVRQGIEQFDKPEEIHLSYVVSGSGGAGLTVMRTTFLGLMYPFKAWINGQWQMIKPYSDRQSIQLPDPYNKVHVYWYEMPETLTLAEAFPVQTVVTKFGSVPDLYNHLTWIAAHIFPKAWIQSKAGTEFLSQVSYSMTNVSDRFSGIGVGIRSEVTGQHNGQTRKYVSTLVHENTAIAAGYGTGSIVQLLLSGELHKPGVWPVEEALPTDLFEATLRQRGVTLHHDWSNSP
jgi:saccharopine dehydrogenase-like NADP-dependent oxidoreductase